MELLSKLFSTKLSIITCCFFLLFTSEVNAQYEVNGDATQDDCNCYTLTQDLNTQSGSVWNENKISLNNSFDYKFEVFLGYNDAGADGIAFVLQPISTSVGSSGGGMGYEMITPAVGVTIDTYQNTTSNDPTFDHIAIQLNGDIDHGTSNNIAGPVTALASGPDIEDGLWHNLRITWNVTTTKLEAYIDGSLRVSATIDLINNVFGGDPEVFWGFTGSTGGARNLQQFCTQNNAGFSLDQAEPYCLGDEVDFQDGSSSFGDIIKWDWDFGDGISETSTTQGNTSHTYTSAGDFKVILQIEGNDGCTASDSITVTVLQLPTATISGSIEVCQFDDSPEVTFTGSNGTSPYVFTYSWSDGTDTIIDSVFTIIDSIGTIGVPTNIPGTFTYSLIEVHNKDAISCSNPQPDVVIVKVIPMPDVSFTADSIEGNCPFIVNFNNTSNNTSQYSWIFGDGKSSSTNDTILQHTFEEKGSYSTMLIGNNQGCRDTAYVTITVFCPEMEYKFPNIFTPNGDGENDSFHIIDPKYIRDFEIVILNRWGNVVFESLDVDFKWDGRINNSARKATEGTYFYKATLTDFYNETVKESGFVQLTLGN